MGIVAKITEPITHKQEIQDLLDDAQQIYDKASDRLQRQKEQTTERLESLGKVKLQAWSEGMESFADAFSAFKNIEMVKKLDTNTRFLGYDEEPKQMLMNIEQASMTATEVAKAGFAAVGTGALVGIASYGGAMMFGSASTGTAIAALTGAAKTNATLAWFGGGAKAAGGLGILGGKLVLAGVVVAPIIAVAAIITNAKSKEKLAEAKSIHAQAEDAAAKMKKVTTGMQGISRMSDNYSAFIKKLNKKFEPFILELNRIKNSYDVGPDGCVDFDLLTPVEQKTLHLSWLMAQVYYHVLSAPILNSNGEVSEESTQALAASKKELKQIRKDTFKMVGDDAPVADIVWKPESSKMKIINFIIMGIILVSGILTISSSVLKGVLLIVSSLIACPLFFKFKDLPESRLYIWRLVRLIGAIVVALVVETVL